MNIDELIILMQNRIQFLEQEKIASIQRGDVVNVLAIDELIIKTQTTLTKLQSVV